MTEEEIRAHAARLIAYHNDQYEFSLVYEDDELEEVSHEDQIAILDAIHDATVTVSFEN
jgi:hypothetical protein